RVPLPRRELEAARQARCGCRATVRALVIAAATVERLIPAAQEAACGSFFRRFRSITNSAGSRARRREARPTRRARYFRHARLARATSGARLRWAAAR